MTNQIVLYISSTDSKCYYPDNWPGDFTVKFPEPIQLEGQWTLTLLDIKCTRRNNSDLYVMCDAIQDTYVNGGKEPVLQYVPGRSRGGRVVQSFDGNISPLLTRPTLITLRIYIRDQHMNPALLRDEKTTCTLLLEKA